MYFSNYLPNEMQTVKNKAPALFAFFCYDKSLTEQTSLGEEEAYLPYTSLSQSMTVGSWPGTQARKQRQELKYRPQRNPAYQLSSSDFFGYFSYSAHTHLMALPTVCQALLHYSAIKNVPIDMPTGQYNGSNSSTKVSFSHMIQVCIKFTKLTTITFVHTKLL